MIRAPSRTRSGNRPLVYTALVNFAMAVPRSGDLTAKPVTSSSAKSPIRLMEKL